MQDFKAPRPNKVSGNRRIKPKKAPRDWKKFFHRALRVVLVSGSLVLLVAGVGLAAHLISTSGFFNVDSVRVVNQNRVSEEDVLARSDVRKGSSIFSLDLEMIGGKIAENPWIAKARVERVFPREVIIHVEEHQPRAIVHVGYLYYVDAAGEVFKILEPEDSLALPLITGLERQQLLEKPQESRKLLLEAMELIAELESRQTFNLEDVSEIHIDPVDGFALYTYRSGIPVLMGFGSFASKLDRLEQIYADLEPRLAVLKYIDLNVMERVIVKVEKPKTTGKG
jgi:cell division protein FtsQ